MERDEVCGGVGGVEELNERDFVGGGEMVGGGIDGDDVIDEDGDLLHRDQGIGMLSS